MNLITELEKLREKLPHTSGGDIVPTELIGFHIERCCDTCHRCQLDALIAQAKREQGDVAPRRTSTKLPPTWEGSK